MKQRVGKLRLILLTLLALTVFATATAFIAENFGDKIFASADIQLEYDENGIAIVEDEDGSKGYFNLTDNGDGNVVLVGFTSQLYRALGAKADLVSNINVPFKLVVPKKVTHYAFKINDTNYLKDIVFPYDGNLVTISGSNMFIGADGLTEIYFPSSATFNYSAFRGGNIKTIQFVNSNGEIVTESDNGTYTTVNGGEAVLTDNGETLFWGSVAAVEKIVSDEAYANVTGLGKYCFANRIGFDEVVIPSRITSMDPTVFANCSFKYISGEGENSVFTIKDNTVVEKSDSRLICAAGGEDGCAEIPEGTKILGDNCLQNNALLSVKLPKSLEYFRANVYVANHRMDISIADGNETYYSIHPETGEELHCIIERTNDGDIVRIGTGSTDLSKLPDSVYAIGIESFAYMDTFTDLVVPEFITELWFGAFTSCSLQSITIHDGLTFKESNHFVGTPYFNDPANWDKGQIFYIGNILVSVSADYSGEYSIRNGTRSILGNAFSNCNRLTKITIPEKLKRINDAAFGGCISLTSVEIPASVEYVGRFAFNGCTALKQVTLPDNTETVYDSTAFAGYTGKIIAPNYATYQSVGAQITSNKANLTYETNVTVNVGETVITLQRLANYGLGYRKVSGVWTNGDFEVGGIDLSGVEYWTINGGATHYTTEELALYKAPVDGSAITLTAHAADDSEDIPVTLVKPKANNPVITYGESEKFSPEEEFEGFFFNTMKLTYTGADGKESEQVPFEAGEYAVKIYPMTSNWKDTNDNSAYEIGTLTIKPAEVEIIWGGVGESTLDFEYVYDGKAHLPSAYFVDVNGDKVLLNSYISLADGDGKNAGSYVAQLTVADGDFANYTLVGSVTQDFTVAQREIVVEWDENKLFSFTSFDVEPKLKWSTDYSDGKFKVEYELTAKEGSELTAGKAVMPGEYVITLTLTGSDNYFITADSLVFEFTIDQPDASVIYWESGTENGAFVYEYDGEVKLPLAYYINPLNSEKTYLEEGILGGACNAGVYTARISLWVLAKYNLSGQVECDFEIVKKQVEIEWDAEKLDFVYNGKLQKPVAYFTGVNGERIMLEINIEEGDSIDVGNYTATVVMADFANYDIVGGNTAKSFSIEKKVLTAVWNGSEFIYNGGEQTATFSIEGYDGETSVEYFTLAGEKLEGKPVEVGTYVMKVSLEDGNYQLKNSSFTFNIEPVKSITTDDGGINWLVMGLIIGVGTAALLGLIALIVALKRRGKVVATVMDDDGDDDGFYDDYYGPDVL